MRRITLAGVLLAILSAIAPLSSGAAPRPASPLAAPVAILSTTTRATLIGVSWSPTSGANRYQLRLTKQGGSASGERVVEALGTLMMLDGVAPKTTYEITVVALQANGLPLSEPSKTIVVTTPALSKMVFAPPPSALRVASYNIMCSHCGSVSWPARRSAVATTIRGQAPDVLGIQEANNGRSKQFLQLVSSLGGAYRGVDLSRNGNQTRIVYNSATLRLISRGTRKLTSAGGAGARYVVWAVFEQRATGKRFLFVTTHLEYRDGTKYFNLRKQQTSQVLAAVRAQRRNLPVIVTGDWNSDKWAKPSNAPYDMMVANGFVDPLGNIARSKGISSRAIVERRIHTNYWSVNHYKRVAQRYAPGQNGVNIDQIFVTPMRVSEFEVVVRVDSKGRFIGVIPSDHNMLRADVWLP